MLSPIACILLGTKLLQLLLLLCSGLHAGLDILKPFHLPNFQNFTYSYKDYKLFTIFRRKLCKSPLAWLAILLAPGYYWTVRYVRLAMCWAAGLPRECTIIAGQLQSYDILFRTPCVNTLRLRQDGCHFPDIFKCIFLYENVKFRSRIYWSLFLRVQLTLFQHWFR